MIHTIGNDTLEVSIKSLGAELTSLKTVSDNFEFLWQGDATYWKGQAYNLFPIIGGIPDDKYALGGCEYIMKSHGFVRNSEFEAVEKSDTSLCLRLKSDAATLESYPYRFELFITYRVEGNTLHHGYRVNNLDTGDMLFSIGGHPGFHCPLYAGESMEDYRLVFEKPEFLERRLKVGSLLSGEKKPFMAGEQEKQLTHSLFYDGAVILDAVRSEWLEIRSGRNPRVIRVEFGGFPYLGIWSSMNDGPFVCIEPWFGIDSSAGDPYDLDKKEGMLRLEPGKSFACEYRIQLK